MPRLLPALALLALAALLPGCVTAPDPITEGLLHEPHAAARDARPLGGEALAQRKEGLERTLRDLVHLRATLVGLHHRHDRGGFILFRQFADAYLGTHVEPLLESEWQSGHPELMALDANVRLLEADLLMWMRDAHRMQRVIDEISRRYAGRESILVDYPIGERRPLGEALELLQQRKWRG